MAADAAPTRPARSWEFGQCFGEKDVDEEFSEADMLSAVKFDESGDYLATGDKGGRIVIFERTGGGKGLRRRGQRGAGLDTAIEDSSEYKFYTEFQSHEAEFDYLKSLEIEEKINQISWCRRSGPALFLLSTNDKTIKLWKVFEKQQKAVGSMNVEVGRFGAPVPVSALRVPTLTVGETQLAARARRVYSNAHAYHINSIAVNSDGQTFLSADDLRINLWSLDNAKLSYNIVDIKPPTLEELTEVITAAEFHPTSCNVFMYSSSRGTIKLADMRAAALCDRHSKQFEEQEDASTKSYFSEIIASVSDIEFSRDGRYIVSRDYLTIKVWDVNMEAKPVQTIPVHEHLRSKLCELYESDCIFDKFEVSCCGDGRAAMTGSYNNCFKIYDFVRSQEATIELSKSRPKAPTVRSIPGGGDPPLGNGILNGGDITMGDVTGAETEDIDYAKKVLHYSWHPYEDIVAVAGLNNLYIYNA